MTCDVMTHVTSSLGGMHVLYITVHVSGGDVWNARVTSRLNNRDREVEVKER